MSEKYTPHELQDNFEAREYFKLFDGQTASLNVIRRQTPMMEHAIHKMIDVGFLVGQRTLPIPPEGEDILLFTNPDHDRTR